MFAAACYLHSKLPNAVTTCISSNINAYFENQKSEEYTPTRPVQLPNVVLGTTVMEHDKLWARLRPLPGLMLWFCIALCFVLPYVSPTAMCIIMLLGMIQNLLQLTFSSMYTFQGFRKMEKSMMDPVTIPPMPQSRNRLIDSDPIGVNMDPMALSNETPDPEVHAVTFMDDRSDNANLHPAETMHMIAICRCTEPVEVLEEVIDHLACHSNRRQYIILLCLEDRDKNCVDVGEGLIARYSGFFARVMYVVHPSGNELEVPGKSANVNYAVRSAYNTIEMEWGRRIINRIVVTVADCDAKVSEHYFNELSVRFAAAEREQREAFWAPPSLFDIQSAEDAAAALNPEKEDLLTNIIGPTLANLFRSFFGKTIPSPVVIADQMWSMFVLQNLSSVNWVRLPCSTYSVGLRLIASVGFWDYGVESVPEDYHTSLKIYWGSRGSARLEPIYHPVLYQHIDGNGWFNTVRERFQQGIRHMWGATDMAYILWLWKQVPKVPIASAIRIVLTVLDVHISACSVVFISTFALPIMSFLKPEFFQTPMGSRLLTVHQICVAVLFCVTLLTGIIYEWYCTEMVQACKRRENITGATPGDADHLLEPPVTSPSYQMSPPPEVSSASISKTKRHPIVMGMIQNRSRGVFRVLARTTRSQAWKFFLKILPWFWAPIVAFLYLFLPAAVAQTRLIFNNRMKKLHVSPKNAPVNNAASRLERLPLLQDTRKTGSPDGATSPISVSSTSGSEPTAEPYPHTVVSISSPEADLPDRKSVV